MISTRGSWIFFAQDCSSVWWLQIFAIVILFVASFLSAFFSFFQCSLSNLSFACVSKSGQFLISISVAIANNSVSIYLLSILRSLSNPSFSRSLRFFTGSVSSANVTLCLLGEKQLWKQKESGSYITECSPLFSPPSIYPFFRLSVCLCLSVCIFLSTYLSVCLSIYLSMYVSINLQKKILNEFSPLNQVLIYALSININEPGVSWL